MNPNPYESSPIREKLRLPPHLTELVVAASLLAVGTGHIHTTYETHPAIVSCRTYTGQPVVLEDRHGHIFQADHRCIARARNMTVDAFVDSSSRRDLSTIQNKRTSILVRKDRETYDRFMKAVGLQPGDGDMVRYEIHPVRRIARR